MVAKGTESLYQHCSNTVTQKWRVCSFLHVVVSIVIVNNFYLARVIKVCAVCNYGFFTCCSIRSLLLRGTQREFLESICLEEELRSKIFGTFCCKISCLPAYPRIFEHLKKV